MLVFDRYGDGPRPVLLLHGFLGSGRNLSTLARLWTTRDRGVTAITADLPGHGRSAPLRPDADLRDAASVVVALCDALFPTRAVHIVGHSLGGRVALRALESAPGRVDAVTLLDIAPGPVTGDGTTRRTVALLRAAPATFPDRATARALFVAGGLPLALADWLLMNLHTISSESPLQDTSAPPAVPTAPAVPPHTLCWRMDREALSAFIDRTILEDLWPVVAAYRGRVRCIRGAVSSYVGDEDVAAFARLGVVSVTTLAEAGHFLHVDALAALLDALVLEDFPSGDRRPVG